MPVLPRMQMNFLETSWIAHTKGKYPREFATPNRLKNPVTCNEDIIKLIKAYGPSSNIFCLIYYLDKWERVQKNKKAILVYENAVIDTIFIDLDCDNLHYAHYEAKMLDLYLRHYDCNPRVYFTGNKGFALYIDFPEVRLIKETVKIVLRTYLESIQSVLALKSIDRGCFDCISRISRIPNTINHKSGLYCIPLSREELWNPLSKIKELAQGPSKTPVIITECDRIPGILLSIESQLQTVVMTIPTLPLPVTTPRARGSDDENDTTPTSLCPGIVSIIDGVSKGGRDNSLCAIICALHLQTKKDKDEILKITKNWVLTCSPTLEINDFELKDKIEYLTNSNYRPCTFAMKTGNKLCQKCPVAKR